MPEEPNHLGVIGGAYKGHVAVSEGAIDLQVEARFGGLVSVLSEGLHPVGGQVKVEAVGTNLRSGYLMSKESEERKGNWRDAEETLDQIISGIIKSQQ